MAKTNLGKVGLTPKKAYSASITYERLDFVTAGDSSYVSLQDNNLGHPVTDGAWWQVLGSGAASTGAATPAPRSPGTRRSGRPRRCQRRRRGCHDQRRRQPQIHLRGADLAQDRDRGKIGPDFGDLLHVGSRGHGAHLVG
nr:MAG TPA: hypothetical protein [Bacteriophage sp.]